MADSMKIGGRQVTISHPDKVVFPPAVGERAAVTKADLVSYYLAVADGALRGVADRPMILKRFVKGIAEEAIFQKRAPEKRPDWIEVAELRYARGGTSAKEAVLHEPQGWRGRSTSAASISIRTRSAPVTSTIPTSCVSTSIRCRVSTGRRSWMWPRWRARCSRTTG